MRLRSVTALLLATAIVAGCATAPAVDAPTLLREAEAALGSTSLKTLVVSGAGTGASFGQAYNADTAWPGITLTTMTRMMNFETGALREDSLRSRREPKGGSTLAPMGTGESRSTLFTRDGFAWGIAANGNAAPNPSVVANRQHDLWTTTPHGALKAAARNNAVAGVKTIDGRRYDTLAFTVPGQLQATLLLDAQRRVVRIESVMPNTVLGDTPVQTEFSDWKESAGLKYPARVRQALGGSEVLDLAIQSIKADEPIDVVVPLSVRNFRENINYDPVLPGLWFITGGSHNSVLIEQADQLVLVQAPQYDGRANAVIEVANTLVPGKTVKTVIASHHHFDHAGGLRAAVAAGAVLVTSDVAKPFFEKAFANPNRIAPDRLTLSPQPVRIVGVSGKTVLNDPQRPIEIHEIQDSIHSRGLLMVWLPRQRLLIEADAYTPGNVGAPLPTVPPPEALNLVRNIERLNLDVDAIMPLRGRGVQMGDLLAYTGRAK